MNKISEKELLAILGFDDPFHSFQWYRDHYPELPNIVKKFIKEILISEHEFPKGISNLNPRERRRRYYLTIERDNSGFVVKRNNTDRGEVWGEKYFDNIDEAIKYFISISFAAGGSIKNYW